MGKYAVVNRDGKQYRVVEGEDLLIEGVTEDKKLEFGEVLLVSDGGKITLGNPFIKGAKAEGSVVGAAKGEKINVRKYKSKSRSRRAIGHRSKLIRVKVDKILV